VTEASCVFFAIGTESFNYTHDLECSAQSEETYYVATELDINAVIPIL
jgi:hypothetical protein